MYNFIPFCCVAAVAPFALAALGYKTIESIAKNPDAKVVLFFFVTVGAIEIIVMSAIYLAFSF